MHEYLNNYAGLQDDVDENPYRLSNKAKAKAKAIEFKINTFAEQ